MEMWIKETSPKWDENKIRLLIQENPGCFNLENPIIGEKLFGIWYKLDIEKKTEGYLRISELFEDDIGDSNATPIYEDYEAEIVISKKYQRKKHGLVGLQIIEEKAKELGGKKIHAIVKSTNPGKDIVINWLKSNGFENHTFGEEMNDIKRQRISEKTGNWDVTMVKKLIIE